MKRRASFIVGACVAGLLLGGIDSTVFTRTAAAAPPTQTATFALG